ncbi:MAG: hypothetical protein LKI18_08145 [Prevotella sp.]|jgi:hypothetical protein|nr:hypothetical protein [Prevotella sp.]
MRNRVYFFSKSDLSVGYNLEIAEKRIKEIKDDSLPNNLADIIEHYGILES